MAQKHRLATDSYEFSESGACCVDLMETSAESACWQELSSWLDVELESLEERFRDFWTRSSFKSSLGRS